LIKQVFLCFGAYQQEIFKWFQNPQNRTLIQKILKLAQTTNGIMAVCISDIASEYIPSDIESLQTDNISIQIVDLPHAEMNLWDAISKGLVSISGIAPSSVQNYSKIYSQIKSNEKNDVVIAIDKKTKEIIGSLLIFYSNAGFCGLYNFYVESSYGRSGIGTKLIMAIFFLAKKKKL